MPVAADSSLLAVDAGDDKQAVQVDVGRILKQDDLARTINHGFERDSVQPPVRGAHAIYDRRGHYGGERRKQRDVLGADATLRKER